MYFVHALHYKEETKEINQKYMGNHIFFFFYRPHSDFPFTNLSQHKVTQDFMP